MKARYLFLFFASLPITSSISSAHDEQKADIDTILQTLAAQDEVIKNLNTKIEELKSSSKEQFGSMTTRFETVEGVTARLEKTLPVDGSLWLKDQRVIDVGGGWHRSYGDTGWYNGTHGGGWHMNDKDWIRSYGGKNVLVNKMLRADDGFQVDGKQVIDQNAGWHSSYGDSGWRNETYGGGWFMSDDSWIRSYGGKDVFVDGVVNATRGLKAGSKWIVGNSGDVNLSPKYSETYLWYHGEAAKKMKKASEYACYQTGFRGDGGNLGIGLRIQNDWWYLGGQIQSHQGDMIEAICVTFN